MVDFVRIQMESLVPRPFQKEPKPRDLNKGFLCMYGYLALASFQAPLKEGKLIPLSRAFNLIETK
jgi:hypothetical protein